MLEAFCRGNVWEQCKRVTGLQPHVHLKGKPIPHWEYEGFYDGFSGYTVYDKGLASKIMREHNGSYRRKAVGFFSRNGEKIFQEFVNERFHGDWREAILEKKTFGYLWNEFEDWFDERRRLFMEKTDDLLAKMPKQLTKDGRIKQTSHGGIANLLKVLTRTMEQQGSSIRTIAKTQYMICMQSGIYIPDEFLTDVLVVADINPKILDNE